MLLKYTVLFLVIVAVQSATLQGRNIPVEIRYERYDHDITSNLAEKVQLSPVELKENQLRLEKLRVTGESQVPSKDDANFIKNLDEKVQLSPEELRQAYKHIPVHHSLQEEDYGDIEKLGELRSAQPQETLNTKLIQQAQDIIEKGLENLRKNFVPKENEIAPPKELWEKLEKDVKQYITEQKNTLGSRQDQGAPPQNIFQSFLTGLQGVTNNFIQQVQGQTQNSPNGTSSDEGPAGPTQPQGPIQGFIGYFTGGVQNIVSNIQNLGQNGQPASGNSTVLGDTPTGQQPPNFIGSFVNGVQQFFQGPQQGINQVLSGNSTQGASGSPNPAGGQQGFFAGAISQINQVVGNIVSTSQKPPGAQGDDGTNTNNQPGNPIQQVFQSFGNLGTAFNQFIQGGQQNKPQGPEDETSSKPPNQNFIQNIGQNIGSAFQNFQNQFRPTQKPAGGGQSTSSNPIIEQVSNVGTQIQQVAQQAASNNPFQNIIPGSSSENSAKNPPTDKPTPAQADPVSEKAQPDENKSEDSDKKEVMTATE